MASPTPLNEMSANFFNLAFSLILVPADEPVLVAVGVLEPIVRVLLRQRLEGTQNPGVQLLSKVHNMSWKERRIQEYNSFLKYTICLEGSRSTTPF